jgi:hypothetical protein
MAAATDPAASLLLDFELVATTVVAAVLFQ